MIYYETSKYRLVIVQDERGGRGEERLRGWPGHWAPGQEREHQHRQARRLSRIYLDTSTQMQLLRTKLISSALFQTIFFNDVSILKCYMFLFSGLSLICYREY